MKASKNKLFAALLMAFLSGACILNDTEPIQSVSDETDHEPQETLDYCQINIKPDIQSELNSEIQKLDCFIYSDKLESHICLNSKNEFQTKFEVGKYCRIILIANAFGSFNESALLHYDNWDNLELYLKNERNEAPIMGGKNEFKIKKDSSITVTLKPLISIIHIRSITHHLGDDVILENPRIWIEGISNKARLFQEEGYTPLEQSDSKPIVTGTDIGVYTQYPDIKFVVYPNEMPPSFFCPTTKVVLECEYNGKDTRQFRYEVHPIYRNTYIPLDLDIW